MYNLALKPIPSLTILSKSFNNRICEKSTTCDIFAEARHSSNTYQKICIRCKSGYVPVVAVSDIKYSIFYRPEKVNADIFEVESPVSNYNHITCTLKSVTINKCLYYYTSSRKCLKCEFGYHGSLESLGIT